MSATTSLPRLLTAEDVAAATGLPKATVYAGAREGWLPVVRIGRACRFSEPAILEWIARGGTGQEGES